MYRFAIGAVVLAGCVVGSAENPDDTAMLETAMTYRTAYTKLDRAGYTSSVGTFEIHVYASGDVATYKQIHPDVTGSHAVAVGTVIVREVLDARGATSALTVMAKREAGYDPTLGDWWFAKTDTNGTVMTADDGTPQVGRVVACHSCHIPRASDDFLFGVPASAM